MRADPKGVVEHLRRAEREGDGPLADFLAGEIVTHLERLDRLEEGAGVTVGEVLTLLASRSPGGRSAESIPSVWDGSIASVPGETTVAGIGEPVTIYAGATPPAGSPGGQSARIERIGPHKAAAQSVAEDVAQEYGRQTGDSLDRGVLAEALGAAGLRITLAAGSPGGTTEPSEPHVSSRWLDKNGSRLLALAMEHKEAIGGDAFAELAAMASMMFTGPTAAPGGTEGDGASSGGKSQHWRQSFGTRAPTEDREPESTEDGDTHTYQRRRP